MLNAQAIKPTKVWSHNVTIPSLSLKVSHFSSDTVFKAPITHTKHADAQIKSHRGLIHIKSNCLQIYVTLVVKYHELLHVAANCYIHKKFNANVSIDIVPPTVNSQNGWLHETCWRQPACLDICQKSRSPKNEVLCMTGPENEVLTNIQSTTVDMTQYRK